MGQKFNLKKLRKQGYKISLVSISTDNMIYRLCILCETRSQIDVCAAWVDDRERKVVLYNLCRSCGQEFFNLSDNDRNSITKNVIETKIASLPHRKFSEFGVEENVRHK